MVVDAYRTWLAQPTGNGFHAIGKGIAAMERLGELGFRIMPRTPDHDGRTLVDVWMRKDDRVDPASELGRMIGLAMPASNPNSQQADKVEAMVASVNSQFTRWLLHHADGSTDSQTSSPTFRVQVDGLSAADCTLLRNLLVPHGWRVASHHTGASTTLCVSRAAPFSCPRHGFLSQQQQQQ